MNKAMKDASLIPLGGFCDIIEPYIYGALTKTCTPLVVYRQQVTAQSNGAE